MVATVHCKASEYHLSVPRDLLTSRITLLFEYSKAYFAIVVITLLSNYLIMISITLLSNHYLIITIVLLLFYWYR
ncbi:hypothetical protein BD769DRAFT_1474360 [Suillus cothurnatus]|nr:hypothetical protein BD769DRAFT_1474360 [Suillus cothurnatus]